MRTECTVLDKRVRCNGSAMGEYSNATNDIFILVLVVVVFVNFFAGWVPYCRDCRIHENIRAEQRRKYVCHPGGGKSMLVMV